MARRQVAEADNEYSAVPTVTFANEELMGMGTLKGLKEFARRLAVARKLLDRAGYR